MKHRLKRGDLIRRRDVDWFGIVLSAEYNDIIAEWFYNVAWVGYLHSGEVSEQGYYEDALKEWYVPKGSR